MAIPTITRDALIAKYTRDYKFRNPDAIVGPGSVAYLDASLIADYVMPLYAEANNLAGGHLTSTQIEDEAESLGLPRRLPATGATGFVIAKTATGGATIRQGSELRHDATSTRYQCLVTALYQDGALVPVQGTDTGVGTNLPAGTVLKWTAPAPGLLAPATVFEDAYGNGLTGGAPEESDDQIQARIDYQKRNPAVAGNASHYVRAIKETPGVPVEAAWAYPCIQGPGGNAVLFTIRPTSPGANRIPSGLLVAQVAANLAAIFPGDDNIIQCTITPEPTDLALRVRWKRSASGWMDATPWPPYSATAPFRVSAVTTPVIFQVQTTDPAPVPPQPGRTIAFWDAATLSFKKKRIATVTVASPGTYDLTVDLAGNASDPTFFPVVGQRVSPWSEDMIDLAAAVVAHFDTRGPGEQVANYFDLAGIRERRTPPSAGDEYPKDLDGNLQTDLQAVPSVNTIVVAEPDIPHEPPIGVRAVASYMLTVGQVSVFPL